MCRESEHRKISPCKVLVLKYDFSTARWDPPGFAEVETVAKSVGSVGRLR